ncbi:ethanolamine utilization protein EutH [Betaproteobacteria bacterium]|nr:ethanolamine utilization protein EutH [Betaproteobacteria bacterium]
MVFLNKLVLYMMMFFMVIGAIDRILAQYGGSEKILGFIGLGRFGRSIDGSGAEFEAGFNAMGPVAMGMVGVIALTPVLAKILGPMVIPLYQLLGADPSMFATTILANDMGGYFLAKELASVNGVTNNAAWMYSGLVLGALLGPTIAFTIPVGVGLIDKGDRSYFALGILAGLVTIPIGCLAGGIVAMYSDVMVDKTPVIFDMKFLLINLIPVILFSLIIGMGLKLFPETMIKAFNAFAKLLLCLITIGLVAIVIETLTQGEIKIIPGMDPIFMVEGDKPGVDMRAMEVIGAIAILLLGAYPMVLMLTRWFEKPLVKLASLLSIDNYAAVGMIGSLANILLMFQAMSKMTPRGKVIAVAFSVSAAWTFGDHLGFTAANKPDMIMAMVVAKLVAGFTALFLAMIIVRSWKNDSVTTDANVEKA